MAASAEYLATFRSDVGSFLDLDLIERAIEAGRRERAPLYSRNGRRDAAPVQYVAFCDPSGGTHEEFHHGDWASRQRPARVGCLRGVRPPFDPSAVVKEFCDLLKKPPASTT